MFLSQINVFRGKGVTDSHELAVFLQHLSTSYIIISKESCLLHMILKSILALVN